MTDKDKMLLGIERRRRLRVMNCEFDRPEHIGYVVCTVLDDLAKKVLTNKEVKKYG